MPLSITGQVLEEVREQAYDRCIDEAGEVIKAMLGPDGSAPGDHTPSRADRIARFVDYADRGILDILKGMGAPVYNDLVNEYVSDMAASPLMQPTPSTAPYLAGVF